MTRTLSLALWLAAPKLRADTDAPHPAEGRSSSDTGPGTPCADCHGMGILSYHDLPGSYGVEPCPRCSA